ncbi:hypothetical protein KIW84_024145 [Lathyrus oleraceus]|uniref:J domain-containing protein n=1 Tax=Pisum sativum TaxID=3888 RepID=A0A9D5BCM8_PEA|nr:hypothetical protein KIW84_024145 [Pisum sativum]
MAMIKTIKGEKSNFQIRARSIKPSTTRIVIETAEKKYDVDGIDLERKYKEWQKKLHPDLVHSKSQKEKDFAAEQSARVIDAYRTLSKPLSRGIYMLKLKGVEIDEEQTISDPELLAEASKAYFVFNVKFLLNLIKQINSETSASQDKWRVILFEA